MISRHAHVDRSRAGAHRQHDPTVVFEHRQPARVDVRFEAVERACCCSAAGPCACWLAAAVVHEDSLGLFGDKPPGRGAFLELLNDLNESTSSIQANAVGIATGAHNLLRLAESVAVTFCDLSSPSR